MSEQAVNSPITYATLLELLSQPIHEKVWLAIPAVEYAGELYTLGWEVSPPEYGWPEGRTYYFINAPNGDPIYDTYTLLECDAWDYFVHIAGGRPHVARPAEGGE